MTIKNIGMSVIAASLLTTSLFGAVGSGTLDMSTGTGTDNAVTVASELLQSGNTVTASFTTFGAGTLVYTADIDGSTTVSDPTMVYIVTGDVTAAVDAAIAGLVGDLAVEDTADGTVVAVFSSRSTFVDAAGDTFTKIIFQGDATVDIHHGHNYAITDDGAASGTLVPISATVTNTSVDDFQVTVDVYSTSGTEELRDHAEDTVFERMDQYMFACYSQLDGMINFENNSITFVPTGHGPADQTSADKFIFDVTKYSVDIPVAGGLTEITIDGTNNFTGALGVSTLTSPTAGAGTVNIIDGNTVEFVTEAADIPHSVAGTTTRYFGNLVTDGATAITPTEFVASVDLEGVATQIPSITYADGKTAGEWMDYTYVAQVPATTSTAATETKIFVVNRSCIAATPTFKLVKDGVVTSVTNVAASGTANTSIAVDTQELYKMQDIIAKAIADGNAIDATGKYAVEIVIPGTAEDFYSYAQAFSTTQGNFKDLPVYNTSVRGY